MSGSRNTTKNAARNEVTDQPDNCIFLSANPPISLNQPYNDERKIGFTKGLPMMKTATYLIVAACTGFVFAYGATANTKDNESDPKLPAWQHRAHSAVQKGLTFLANTQNADGGWTLRDKSDPALTALVAKCFIQFPDFGPDHPVSKRAINFITKSVQPDGGIYVTGTGHANYQTSVCLSALSATRDDKHKDIIAKAQNYLIKGQWDEDDEHDKESDWYGGAGYGKHKRPDLSNTQMMLEALHDSGLPADHPVYKKALQFISRSQMLTESNDQPFARGSTDGGFIYTPVGEGESKAGTETVNGKPRLRSYGSMTYAGFKSLLYCGLSRDDDRVKAALKWIQRHYTLDENPNMPGAQNKQGLFYYYHVFARALDAYGEDFLIDENDVKHPWRLELCNHLADLQRPDGSWINEADRWYEGNPHLVSAYAIFAIQAAVR